MLNHLITQKKFQKKKNIVKSKNLIILQVT